MKKLAIGLIFTALSIEITWFLFSYVHSIAGIVFGMASVFSMALYSAKTSE